MRRKIKDESAPFSRRTVHPDLATETLGELAADGQAESRASELAAGAPVRLLKRLEDQLLLVLGDADPCIAHGESHHGVRRVEFAVPRRPPRLCGQDPQRDLAFLGELERIGKK